MARRTDARTKAIRTAGRLFTEQGYGATGLSQIIEESGSPKGEFSFHFPAGKEQLAVEAIRMSGESVAAALGDVLARSHDTAKLVGDFAALLADVMEGSGFRRGSPIATVTLEMAATSEPIRAAAAAAYDSWIEIVAMSLRRDGRRQPEANRLARHVVAALEGALVLSRAHHSTTPLRETAKVLDVLLSTRS